MHESARTELSQLLHTARVPGAVLAWAQGSQPTAFAALGSDADGALLNAGSLFPVASITKLATALVVLRLVAQGALALDDPLAAYLPEALAAHDGVTIRTLLCHTSGLPLDLAPAQAPYAEGLTWEHLAHACLLTDLEALPWTRVQYSNVGYGLLALVVQQQIDLPFAVALREFVLEPLGIEGYLGQAALVSVARISGVRGQHAGGALEPFNSPFWRSLALPWAGLITNAAGALALLRAFAGVPEGFLPESLCIEAGHDQTRHLAGGFVEPFVWPHCPWGLGPELRGVKNPHWVAPQAGSDSFGHSGASGCLAWYTPQTAAAWVLLGARSAEGGWLLRYGPQVSRIVSQF